MKTNTTNEKQYDGDGNLLMTSTIETPCQASSVEIKFTAKGEFTPTVKVYDVDPFKAANEAMEIMSRLLVDGGAKPA